jgi:O-antigen/teichoic acid export membrane protein
LPPEPDSDAAQGTDTKTLRKDVATYGGFTVLRSSVSLITLPILVHTLSQAEYAALDLLNISVALFTLMIPQLNAGFSRHYFQDRTASEQARYVATLFWTYAAVCGGVALVSVAVIAMGAFGLLPAIPSAQSAAILAIAALPCLILFEFFLLLLRLNRRRQEFIILGLGEAVFRGLASAGLLMLTGTVFGYFAGVFLSVALMTVFVYLKERIWTAKPDWAVLRRILRFVLPVYPGLVGSYISRYATRFLVLSWVTLEQLAVYVVAAKFAIMAKFFAQALSLSWTPIAMRLLAIDASRSKVFFSSALTGYALSSLFGVLAIGLLAAPLIDIIAPDGYAHSKALVPIIAAGFLISGGGTILNIGNQASERTYWQSIAEISGSIAALLVLYALVGQLGTQALAISLMVSAIVSCLVRIFGGQRHFAIAYQPWSVLLLLAGIPACALGLSLLYQ